MKYKPLVFAKNKDYKQFITRFPSNRTLYDQIRNYPDIVEVQMSGKTHRSSDHFHSKLSAVSANQSDKCFFKYLKVVEQNCNEKKSRLAF